MPLASSDPGDPALARHHGVGRAGIGGFDEVAALQCDRDPRSSSRCSVQRPHCRAVQRRQSHHAGLRIAGCTGGVPDDARGIRVFAGQRAETFYIDLGAVFDTLNLRRSPPLLNGAGEDTDTVNPFGINRFARTNISTIALEVPIQRVTRDGKMVSKANKDIGDHASTSREKVTVLRESGNPKTFGLPVQVARLANPLVNELIITTPFKDFWNAQEPEREAQFQSFYKTPVIATALDLVFGGFGVHVPATPRTDLMSVFLKYSANPWPQATAGGHAPTCCGSTCR